MSTPLPIQRTTTDRCPHTDCRRSRAERSDTCLEHAPDPDLPGPFLGISYRQLDYWTRIGLLVPDDPTPGSGIARSWPDSEVIVALLIRRLLDAGLELRAAARVAREQTHRPTGETRLRGGIVLDLASVA
jgi:hypothetical protein